MNQGQTAVGALAQQVAGYSGNYSRVVTSQCSRSSRKNPQPRLKISQRKHGEVQGGPRLYRITPAGRAAVS